MLTLPKVVKGIRRAMSHLEKVQGVVAGVALAMGVLLSGVSASDAPAAATQAIQQPARADSGALLLTTPLQIQHMAQWHSSHVSHASHSSHASHWSHVSSRY